LKRLAVDGKRLATELFQSLETKHPGRCLRPVAGMFCVRHAGELAGLASSVDRRAPGGFNPAAQ
jgi:hypothetical protein